MEKLKNKIDSAIIGAKCCLMAKHEGSDQLMADMLVLVGSVKMRDRIIRDGIDYYRKETQRKFEFIETIVKK